MSFLLWLDSMGPRDSFLFSARGLTPLLSFMPRPPRCKMLTTGQLQKISISDLREAFFWILEHIQDACSWCHPRSSTSQELNLCQCSIVSDRDLLEVAQCHLLPVDFSESCSLLLLIPILRVTSPLYCAPPHHQLFLPTSAPPIFSLESSSSHRDSLKSWSKPGKVLEGQHSTSWFVTLFYNERVHIYPEPKIRASHYWDIVTPAQ